MRGLLIAIVYFLGGVIGAIGGFAIGMMAPGVIFGITTAWIVLPTAALGFLMGLILGVWAAWKLVHRRVRHGEGVDISR
jgi:hypothetical protein